MKPAARRRARECAVQALYSWQLSGNNIADVESEFLSEQDVKDVDVAYFRELFFGAATNAVRLDALMAPYLSRQLEELGQVEKAVLRLAMYELSYREDVLTKWLSTKRLNWQKCSARKRATNLSMACLIKPRQMPAESNHLILLCKDINDMI